MTERRWSLLENCCNSSSKLIDLIAFCYVSDDEPNSSPLTLYKKISDFSISTLLFPTIHQLQNYTSCLLTCDSTNQSEELPLCFSSHLHWTDDYFPTVNWFIKRNNLKFHMKPMQRHKWWRIDANLLCKVRLKEKLLRFQSELSLILFYRCILLQWLCEFI